MHCDRSGKAPPGVQRNRVISDRGSGDGDPARGFGCTPRIAGNVASSPRATRCPVRRPWRGTRSFPGDVGNGNRTEARQGAIRIFSENSIVFRSAPQPTIPASPDARREGWVRCASGRHRRGRMMGMSTRGHLKGSSWIWLHAAHRRKRGELTTRDTVSRTSAVAWHTKLPWGRRERQPDGSAAGGHPHFFRELHRLPERPATHHPGFT